jgi:PIN domain nuclease of toxin-antitoxin system
MVLLDTCALIWWTLDPEKLSETAALACSEMADTGGIISSISIWEIGVKIKKGKIDLGISLEEYVSRLKLLDRFRIIPIDETIWMENIALDWSHKDPADRTIIATAKLENAPIITRDDIIRNFYPDTIW